MGYTPPAEVADAQKLAGLYSQLEALSRRSCPSGDDERRSSSYFDVGEETRLRHEIRQLEAVLRK